MYILLSITECVVIIPQTWGGVFVSLTNDPTVIKQLPPNTPANTQVNIRNADLGQKALSFTNKDGSKITTDYDPKKYDYYFDCGTASKKTCEKAIRLFKQTYENNLDAHLASDDYPLVNPAVLQLQASLQKATSLRPLDPCRFFRIAEKGELAIQPSPNLSR